MTTTAVQNAAVHTDAVQVLSVWTPGDPRAAGTARRATPASLQRRCGSDRGVRLRRPGD
ncbi:MAG: hypothetical protein ACRDTH_14410 [Pseudonocardiaceae bacterium]